MTRLRVWVTRIAGLFRRPLRDRALDDEIHAHLDDLTDDLIAGGMCRADAIVEARRRFGRIDQVREIYRDQRGWPSIDWLRHDITLACRVLWSQRSSTLLAVLSLGLGIGVSMGFFTIVNAICFRGLPIDRPERVLFVSTVDRDATATGVSYADFLDLRREAPFFSGVAAYATAPFNTADEREAAERIAGGYVSAGTFRVLGVAPIVGREFGPADEVDGAPAVVVIGHAVWMSRYGGDPAIVGRPIRVNGAPATIVGVMPEGFLFPGQANAWMPLTAMPRLLSRPRSNRGLAVFGRLSEHATIASARSGLTSLSDHLELQYPETNGDIRFSSIPINQQFNARVSDPVWVAFLTAGVLVLLVACANVANLLLARLAVRSREVALRLAIGATRLRIVRQMLVESIVLAGVSGAVGLAFAIAAVRLLAWSVPESAPLPYWIAFSIDGRVLAALLATCMTSVVFFGMLPAIHSSRVNVNDLLKDGGRHGTTSRRTRFWSATFLAAQFALTLVLLANVSMDLQRDFTADGPGVDINPAGLLTARITLPAAAYGSPDSRRRFFDKLDEQMRHAAGVVSMTVAGQLPPDAGGPMHLLLPGQALDTGQQGEPVFAAAIGQRYFETIGVPLLVGRGLTAEDSVPGHEGVVVNQQLAERMFSGRPVLGQRIALADKGGFEAPPVWRTIVGVAPNLQQGPLPRALAYLPNRDTPPSSAVLIVRANGNTDTIVRHVRRAVADLDPDLPVYRVVTLAAAWRESEWNGRVSSRMLQTISVIALLLAVVGLYGVTSHTVAQRKHEIGIRVALGATPLRVTWLVLRRALTYVGIGLATGLPATWAFERMFIDTSTAQWLTAPSNLLPVVGLMLIVAIAACAWPATRAARIQPSRTLRSESSN